MVYKVHYFENLGGRVEFTKVLLEYGKIPYEMVNIPAAEWPKLKSTYPEGHVPVLEYEGKFLTQSLSIAQYFAKKLNLLGKNDWEEAQAYSFVLSIEDTISALKPNSRIMKIVKGETTPEEEEEATKILDKATKTQDIF
uniref:glutathione transferase n=1 Tax=Steinernema glaseri TaxID=37863 RepID=A0A1I8AWM8_9BILA